MAVDTSIEAYDKLKASGKHIPQRLRIYRELYPDKVKTRREVEAATGMRQGSCGGRVHKLIEMGILRETTYKRTCTQSRMLVHCIAIAQPYHTDEHTESLDVPREEKKKGPTMLEKFQENKLRNAQS